MIDENVYRAVIDAADARQAVALATVLSTRGSVPRHAGSRMMIDPDRGLTGTIGGGCSEADVIAAAREVVLSGVPRIVDVELTEAVDWWSPAVCGGVMKILIEPVWSVRADRCGSRHRQLRAQLTCAGFPRRDYAIRFMRFVTELNRTPFIRLMPSTVRL
jgi:xanthine dehydrogenase accessory factor